MKAGSEIERLAAYVYLMTRKPRIASELADLLGVQAATVRTWMTAFKSEGLVREAGERRVHNSAATVWEWVQ